MLSICTLYADTIRQCRKHNSSITDVSSVDFNRRSAIVRHSPVAVVVEGSSRALRTVGVVSMTASVCRHDGEKRTPAYPSCFDVR